MLFQDRVQARTIPAHGADGSDAWAVGAVANPGGRDAGEMERRARPVDRRGRRGDVTEGREHTVEDGESGLDDRGEPGRCSCLPHDRRRRSDSGVRRARLSVAEDAGERACFDCILLGDTAAVSLDESDARRADVRLRVRRARGSHVRGLRPAPRSRAPAPAAPNPRTTA